MTASAHRLEGMPWLDYDPGDWKRFRVKDIAALSPPLSGGAPAPTETCTVVPMESLSVTGEISYAGQSDFQDVSSGLPNFENGDVLFAKITPCMENGKGAHVVGLPTRYAFGSTEFHVLRPGHKVDAKFLYYYTFNPIFRRYAAENMTGAAGQKRVSSRFLNYTQIWLPDIDAQRRIATYLDNACKAIDGAIDAKQKQLETLGDLRKSMIHKAVTRGLDDSVALKDSSVDWLGNIPAHWQCEHLKRLCSRIQTGSTPPTANTEYYVDGTIPWFAPGSYDGGTTLSDPAKLINEEALLDGKLRIFPARSVFLVGIGATIGKAAMITTDASCNQQVMGLVCNWRVLPEFLVYHMKLYEWIIPSIAQFTTLPIMDQVKIGYLPVVVPRKDEQQAIVDHLDARLGQFARTRETLQAQIGLLTDYRKSLIHECVTGKRRITDDDIQKVKQHA
jgi:type I restriction enzyme, S subunit